MRFSFALTLFLLREPERCSAGPLQIPSTHQTSVRKSASLSYHQIHQPHATTTLDALEYIVPRAAPDLQRTKSQKLASPKSVPEKIARGANGKRVRESAPDNTAKETARIPVNRKGKVTSKVSSPSPTLRPKLPLKLDLRPLSKAARPDVSKHILKQVTNNQGWKGGRIPSKATPSQGVRHVSKNRSEPIKRVIVLDGLSRAGKRNPGGSNRTTTNRKISKNGHLSKSESTRSSRPSKGQVLRPKATDSRGKGKNASKTSEIKSKLNGRSRASKSARVICRRASENSGESGCNNLLGGGSNLRRGDSGLVRLRFPGNIHLDLPNPDVRKVEPKLAKVIREEVAKRRKLEERKDSAEKGVENGKAPKRAVARGLFLKTEGQGDLTYLYPDPKILQITPAKTLSKEEVEERKKEMQRRTQAGKRKPEGYQLGVYNPKRKIPKQESVDKTGKYFYVSKHKGRTAYHPNAQSSGLIGHAHQYMKCREQYGGNPDTPRNTPGFQGYVNEQDPCDRSHLLAVNVKDPHGNKYQAALGVYDPFALPQHAAHEKEYIKDHPDEFFSRIVEDSKSVSRKRRSITKHAAADRQEGETSHKDEKIQAALTGEPYDTQSMKRREKLRREDPRTVVPVREKESRREGRLVGPTKALAIALHEENKPIGQNKPMMGFTTMNSQHQLHDYGNNQWGPYNMPDPAHNKHTHYFDDRTKRLQRLPLQSLLPPEGTSRQHAEQYENLQAQGYSEGVTPESPGQSPADVSLPTLPGLTPIRTSRQGSPLAAIPIKRPSESPQQSLADVSLQTLPGLTHIRTSPQGSPLLSIPIRQSPQGSPLAVIPIRPPPESPPQRPLPQKRRQGTPETPSPSRDQAEKKSKYQRRDLSSLVSMLQVPQSGQPMVRALRTIWPIRGQT